MYHNGLWWARGGHGFIHEPIPYSCYGVFPPTLVRALYEAIDHPLHYGVIGVEHPQTKLPLQLGLLPWGISAAYSTLLSIRALIAVSVRAVIAEFQPLV